MTQKLYSLSFEDPENHQANFQIILFAGDNDEAFRLFDTEIVGKDVRDYQIEEAVRLGEPLLVRAHCLFDTGLTAEALPSGVIPWDKVPMEVRKLRSSDEGCSPTP